MTSLKILFITLTVFNFSTTGRAERENNNLHALIRHQNGQPKIHTQPKCIHSIFYVNPSISCFASRSISIPFCFSISTVFKVLLTSVFVLFQTIYTSLLFVRQIERYEKKKREKQKKIHKEWKWRRRNQKMKIL